MQTCHAVGDHATQDGLTAPQDALAQRLFEMRQAAGLEQHIVAVDLGNQALLRRHRHHLAERHAQHVRRIAALLVELLLHLRRGVQGIPQRVDLVEHDQPGLVVLARSAQMLTPDRQVGTRHTRVRAQDEHHRVRLGNQVDRQLGLGTDGIQARRIQNHKALLEQRMRHIDQCVAPHRHVHHAARVDHRVVVWRIVVPEAQGPRLVDRHAAHLGHLGQGLGHLLRVIDVESNLVPLVLLEAPLGQSLRLQAGLDGQQAKARRRTLLVRQLGRAHGGAARARRHDAAAVVRKEDRVDQLGLAARELRDKRHHHLVAADLLFQALQAFLDGRIHQLVRTHPVRQLLELLRKRALPGAVLIELFVE